MNIIANLTCSAVSPAASMGLGYIRIGGVVAAVHPGVAFRVGASVPFPERRGWADLGAYNASFRRGGKIGVCESDFAATATWWIGRSAAPVWRKCLSRPSAMSGTGSKTDRGTERTEFRVGLWWYAPAIAFLAAAAK